MSIVLAAANFNRGYMSDVSRDQLPAGAAYRMKDWLPQIDMPLRRRGGWTFDGPDLNLISTSNYLTGMAWAPFKDDEHLVIVSDQLKVFMDRNFDGVTASLVGSGLFSNILTHPPVWHPDLANGVGSAGALIFIGPYPGKISGLTVSAQPPMKYTHTAGSGLTSTYTVAALGGSPPNASAGASYGDYFLLANGRRIYVSGVGNAESWTTGSNFWDSQIQQIVGLVPLRSGLLVMGYAQISLITGDTPPAGGNWSERIIFSDTGCFDVRSITKYRDNVIFANNTGVYMTDGTTLTDITLKCGVKQRWSELFGSFGYAGSFSQIASAGIYRGKYIISIWGTGGGTGNCHVFDLDDDIAYEFSNLGKSYMFAHRLSDEGTANYSGGERLFMASRNATKIVGVHSIWSQLNTTPDDAGADGDGTVILPILETPYYKLGGSGQKRFRSARVTYDIRAHAGNTPTLSASYTLFPDGAYTSPVSLPATTDIDRQRADIRDKGLGIGLQITQASQSALTRLAEIELDIHPLEGMR